MALILFRRHLKSCGQTSRRYRRCRCPISVEGTLAGESIRKALNLTSWEAAENLIFEWNRAGRIGTEGHRIALQMAVERFLADCAARELRPATIELYERFLKKHFLAWCEGKGIASIRELDVAKIREYRETWKWAATTSVRRLERLRTFFAFCVDSGWLEKNPAKVLKPPKVQSGTKMPFTEEELSAIFKACDEIVTRGRYGSEENRARVKAFIYILRYTGLRISDATRLDESRVRDGKVFLRTEKTGQLVWVPIPQFVVDALAEVPRIGPFYFQTGNAKPKTVRGGWDRTIRTILELAGVKHGSAHIFRHSFATELLSKGVAVETVAAILGNSPAIVLKHYSHWIRSRQEALENAVKLTWEEPKPKLKVLKGGG